ncbi:membrane dipeptidase [Vibrio lentus]|nr:membrane dipeptidase [Vibrio lentus]
MKRTRGIKTMQLTYNGETELTGSGVISYDKRQSGLTEFGKVIDEMVKHGITVDLSLIRLTTQLKILPTTCRNIIKVCRLSIRIRQLHQLTAVNLTKHWMKQQTAYGRKIYKGPPRLPFICVLPINF